MTDPKVKIDAGSIGGPSAGMMFTLEIYSQITGKDLRQGREIAGTGTINEDGSIGQIGGVDKKLLQQVMRAQKFSFAQMKRKNRQRLLVQQITTQMRLRQLKVEYRYENCTCKDDSRCARLSRKKKKL